MKNTYILLILLVLVLQGCVSYRVGNPVGTSVDDPYVYSDRNIIEERVPLKEAKKFVRIENTPGVKHGAEIVIHEVAQKEFIDLVELFFKVLKSDYQTKIYENDVTFDKSYGVFFDTQIGDYDMYPLLTYKYMHKILLQDVERTEDEFWDFYCRQYHVWDIYYGYNPLTATGLIRLEYRMYPDDELINIFNLFREALLESDVPYRFEGYNIGFKFKRNDRDIGLKSEASITISVLLDAETPVVIGGFLMETDVDGRARFSGDPSLSRITENIIPIRDDDQNEVLAYYDESEGVWYVDVEGQRGGQPFKERIIIESLKY